MIFYIFIFGNYDNLSCSLSVLLSASKCSESKTGFGDSLRIKKSLRQPLWLLIIFLSLLDFSFC